MLTENWKNPYYSAPGFQSRGQIVFETEYVRYVVSKTGYNLGVVDRVSGVDYCRRPGWYPFCSFGTYAPGAPRELTRRGSLIEVKFKKTGAHAVIKVTEKPHYIVFELKKLEGIDGAVFDLASLGLPATGHVGHWMNVVWNSSFAICLHALTPETQPVCDTVHAPAVTRPILRIRTHAALGHVGCKYALIAAPRDEIENVITEVARDFCLPTPCDEHGVPMKKSYRRERSYLFMCHVNQDNQDYALEVAKQGGFGLIMGDGSYTFESFGTYLPHKAHWPGGMKALSAFAKRCHDAGIGFGIHTMSAGLGTNDPLFTDHKGAGLCYDGGNVLAEAITKKTDTLKVVLPPFGALATGTFKLGDEFIVVDSAGTYAQIMEVTAAATAGVVQAGAGPHRMPRVQRGAFGSTAQAHPKGTPMLHVHTWYLITPDTQGPVFDAIARNIAERANQLDADMVYFDGLCGTAVPGMEWYDSSRFALSVYNRMARKNVIFQMSDSWQSLWHIHTRQVAGDAAPGFDETSIEHVRAKELCFMPYGLENLLSPMFDWHGWYAYDANIPCGWQLKPTPATTLDDWKVYLEAARRLDLGLGVQTSVEDCRSNPDTPKMLKMTREYETERIRRLFGTKI